MHRIQLKRGNFSNLPNTGMLAGEPLITLDRGALYVATGADSKIPVLPPIEQTASLGAVAPDDLILVHDVSEEQGVPEKKITFAAFKAALNIPTDSTDEKVAVVAGGTSGYIWGTDGTDGILRLSNSLKWTKDPSNGFVTLSVDRIDGGTF